MGREDDVLLRFKGDASGAEDAARKTQEALKDTDQAAERTAEESIRRTDRTTRAMDDQNQAAKDGSQNFGEFAESMGTSEQQANSFREALGAINPQLAEMMDLGMNAQEIFGFMFSPIGLAAAGAVGAIATVTKALNDAQEAANRFHEAQQKIQEQMQETMETVSGELAKLGKGSDEAANKAAAVVNQLKAKGYDPGAAAQVSAAVVNQAGKLTVDQDTLTALVAVVQTGRVSFRGNHWERATGATTGCPGGHSGEPPVL